LRWERQRREFAPYLNILAGETFHTETAVYRLELVSQLPAHDVLNLHWVAGFIDYGSFFRKIPRTTPIVWTLHDMNPFTGGCHFSGECRGFESSCGMCPLLNSRRSRDLSSKVMGRKRRIFEAVAAERLHIVSPSRWLAAEASRSSLFSKFRVSVIPNGIDTDLFVPRDRAKARLEIGVRPVAKTILFASQSLDDPRKGFQYLRAALERISEPEQYLLLCLGGASEPRDLQVESVYLGALSDNRKLAATYAAADVLVVPSQLDNLPNTVLEALACGTPVVGNPVGGIPDMVRPDRTGELADCRDPEQMSRVIERVAQRSADYSKSCRRIAVDEYSLAVQADRYAQLYSGMLRQTAGS
jgi:glycosyltransferase involved in cell wall biosynthesis